MFTATHTSIRLASFQIALALLTGVSQGQTFTQRTIDTGLNGLRGIFPADIDGDGDTDLLSTTSTGTVHWHENNGDSPPTFASRGVISGLGFMFRCFAADMDNDGDTDLLSVDASQGEVWLHTNNGSQLFAHTRLYNSSFNVTSIFASDIDSDGDPDVLLGCTGENAVRWLENTGATYTLRTVSTGAASVSNVSAIDMDQDGDTDVVAGLKGNDRVVWYSNNGSQGFSTHTITTGLPSINRVFPVDIDNDGDIDVLSADDSDGRVRLHQNNGSQSFVTATIYDIGNSASNLFVADIDRDGDSDIAVTSFADARVVWLRNDGSPGAPDFVSGVVDANADQSADVVIADFDNDGDPDIAAGLDGALDRIRWYENDLFTRVPINVKNLTDGTTWPTVQSALNNASNGDVIEAQPDKIVMSGNFDFLGKSVSLISTGSLDQAASHEYVLADGAALACSDFIQGDTIDIGAAEVVTAANIDGGTIRLRGSLNVPAGASADLVSTNFLTEPNSVVRIEDNADVVAIAPDGAQFSGILSLGNNARFGTDGNLTLKKSGGFAGFAPFEIDTGVISSGRYAVGDVDGDGELDIVFLANISDSRVRILLNQGAQTYTTSTLVNPPGASVYDFALNDIDGDGDLDLFVASTSANSMWHMNNGSGSFSAGTGDNANVEVRSLHAIDFDGDGDDDFVVGGPNSTQFNMMRNDRSGAGTSSLTRIPITLPRAFNSVHAHDFNSDGATDLIGVSQATGEVVLMLNDNTGSATPSFTWSVVASTPGPVYVTGANIDGDGDRDLVVHDALEGAIYWIENNGGPIPTFTKHTVETGDLNLNQISVDDIDGDGRDDIAASFSGVSVAAWYRNNRDGSFTKNALPGVVYNGRGAGIADVDGDGNADILTSGDFGITVRVHRSLGTSGVNALGNGARISSERSIDNAMNLDLRFGATMSAAETLLNTGDLGIEFATILANNTNHADGTLTVTGSAQVVGNLTNNSTIDLDGILSVSGAMTNNGTIQDAPSNARSLGAGFSSEGDLTFGAGATLLLDNAGATLRTAGNYDNAIDDQTRIDLSVATLHMAGTAQTLEVMSTDEGAVPIGFDRSIPGRYPIGTLRIGPGATTVSLVDLRDNDGGMIPEAMYADTLVIEPGATLNTNGLKVYYNTLHLHGTVDDIENLCKVIKISNGCLADFDNDGDVDLGDFGVFGAAFGSTSGGLDYNPNADFDNDGDIDLGDFGLFGTQFNRTDCLD